MATATAQRTTVPKAEPEAAPVKKTRTPVPDPKVEFGLTAKELEAELQKPVASDDGKVMDDEWTETRVVPTLQDIRKHPLAVIMVEIDLETGWRDYTLDFEWFIHDEAMRDFLKDVASDCRADTRQYGRFAHILVAMTDTKTFTVEAPQGFIKPGINQKDRNEMKALIAQIVANPKETLISDGKPKEVAEVKPDITAEVGLIKKTVVKRKAPVAPAPEAENDPDDPPVKVAVKKPRVRRRPGEEEA